MADTWSVLKNGVHLNKSDYLDGEWASQLQAFWKYKADNQAEISAANQAFLDAEAQLAADLSTKFGTTVAIGMAAVAIVCGASWAADLLGIEVAALPLAGCLVTAGLTKLAIQLALTSAALDALYFMDTSRVSSAYSAYQEASDYGKKHGTVIKSAPRT